LLKIADTKNESLFLMMVGIISRHHKKILGVTVNHFSTSASSLTIQVNEKLTKSNYLLWHAQIMLAIRVTQLQGFLNGSEKKPSKMLKKKVDESIIDEPNTAYLLWVAHDQAILEYLLSSLTQEVLIGVATMTTSAEDWRTLASMYSSHMRACSVKMRMALVTAQKGVQSMAEFYSKMRSLADELAMSGHPLEDEEFVAYVLVGLDEDFNPMVSVVVAHVKLISLADLYSQMLSHELCCNRQCVCSWKRCS
jgi:hypothetical protein